MFLHGWAGPKGMVPALFLACAACTPPAGLPAAQGDAAEVGAQAHAGPWWRQSGDALLDEMVAQALGPMEAVCQPPQRGLGGLLHRRNEARRHAEAAERAALRLQKAEAVGLAYLRLRAWQDRLAARRAMLAPWADNAEIAHFRHEAGLVAALDEDMAGVMVGLNATDEAAARAGYDRALGDLAKLTGQDAAALRARLDKTSAMPIGGPSQPAAGSLTARAEEAVANARIAYRGGTTGFATLYVAEANALAAREAQIVATRDAAMATILQWSAKGMGEDAACG